MLNDETKRGKVKRDQASNDGNQLPFDSEKSGFDGCNAETESDPLNSLQITKRKWEHTSFSASVHPNI